MKNLLDLICKKFELVVQENLELGCNSDVVCIATDSTGQKVVIKAATTPNSIAEIEMNDVGYNNLKKYGLDFFIPYRIAYESTNLYAFMIMEYLGPSFLSQVTESKCPMDLYLSLMNGLEKVYSVSLREGAEGGIAINAFIRKIIDIYEKYVSPFLDVDRKMAPLLQKIYAAIDPWSINHCCFSNWDFTLEDVYMTTNGVKYSDPHAEVLGIPIIDMACFGGLIKLYELPFGNEGYVEFRKFATGKVAEILKIPTKKAEKIFYLGKLFQCFMSIRFRYEKNPTQAREIFREAERWLLKILFD